MKLAARIAAVLVISLVVAPTAGAAQPRAKVRTLTGHIMAAPYETGAKVIVPVWLDRPSSRRAKLRTPVGVLMLKKAKKVRVRGQRARVAPALLRAGDRLRARVKVTKSVRRASYWRTPVRAFKLTKRSPTLGSAELQTLLGAFGGDLRRLNAALTGVANYVKAGFDKQAADTDALRGQLGSLATALQSLEKRVEALEAGLPALEASMQAQLDALARDLASLRSDVSTLQTQLGALGGDVAALEDAVTQLNADVTALQASVGLLCGDPLITVC